MKKLAGAFIVVFVTLIFPTLVLTAFGAVWYAYPLTVLFIIGILGLVAVMYKALRLGLDLMGVGDR